MSARGWVREDLSVRLVSLIEVQPETVTAGLCVLIS